MLKDYTITDLHHSLITKKISSLEIVQSYFTRINEIDKNIGAYLSLFTTQACSQAKLVDKKIKNKEKISLLAGIPLAIKDNILLKDDYQTNDSLKEKSSTIRCSAGSKMLQDYQAPYDASVVKKLKKNNAIFLGRTNMDEFAMGSSTENSAFFPTKNPRDLTRVPGGSSGGSAAAVASNQCVYALGSDTNGSIRQPASFCGIVGLKPTYGAISRYGLIAMASSLDQIGILAKTVTDTEIIFKAIEGQDEMDSMTVKINKPISTITKKIQNLRIGIPEEYFTEGIDPKIKKNIEETILLMEKLKIKIEKVKLPHTKYALATYYIIAPAEVSSNLARYDGIKYGPKIDKQKFKTFDWQEAYSKLRKENLGSEVKRRIILGTYVLSAGYYEAFYLKAQKVRQLIQADFEAAFSKFDFFFTPVTPTVAFKIGEKQDPLSMYLSDIYTSPTSLAGLPALSLPINKNQVELPIGLQIIANYWQEKKLFFIGKIIEKLIDRSNH